MTVTMRYVILKFSMKKLSTSFWWRWPSTKILLVRIASKTKSFAWSRNRFWARSAVSLRSIISAGALPGLCAAVVVMERLQRDHTLSANPMPQSPRNELDSKILFQRSPVSVEWINHKNKTILFFSSSATRLPSAYAVCVLYKIVILLNQSN